MAVQVRDSVEFPGVHGHAIAQLSSDLNLPFDEVAAVYGTQLERIGESARIRHYLCVLATSRARSILRESGRAADRVGVRRIS